MSEDIRLSIGIDESEVQKEASNLQKEIAAIFKNVSGEQLDKQFKQLLVRLDKTSTNVSKVQNKIAELATEKIPTKQYTDLQKDFAKAYKEFEKLDNKVREAKSTGSVYGSQFTELYVNFLNAQDKADALLSTMIELERSGQAFTLGSDSEEFSNAVIKLNQLTNSMKIATSSAYELRDGLQEAVSLELDPDSANVSEELSQTEQMSELLKGTFELAGNAITRVGTALSNVADYLDKLYSSLSNLKKSIDTVLGTLKKVYSKVKSIFSLATRRLSGVNKMTRLQDADLKKIISKMLKWGLGIRSLFILWRKLRAYAQDALKLMAQQFEEVDKDVSDIINTFNQFKNMIGTVVQPLMHEFAPAIIAIIDLLNKANVALANFFAVFTGQKYIYKAKKSNDSYAESLKGTGSAAKEAKEELAEYDNLLVIPQDNSGSSGRGSGDDEELLDNFEKTLAHSQFAEQLKAAIHADDWDGVGTLFAEKLNTITLKLNSWINDEFKPQAIIWADRLGRTLNGLVAETKFDTIGDTIGDAIMTGLETMNTFLKRFSFTRLGKQIASGINGLTKAIDGDVLGETLGLQFNSIVDLLVGIVEDLDFNAIADALSVAFNSFLETADPAKLASGISTFLVKLLGAIARFISQIERAKLGETLGEVFANMEWESIFGELGNILAGLIDGVSTAFDSWENVDANSASIAKLVITLWALSEVLGVVMPLIQGIGGMLRILSPIFTKTGKLVVHLGKFFSNLGTVINLAASGAGTLHEAMVAVFGSIATTIAGVVAVVGGLFIAIKNFIDMLINGFSWLKEIFMVIGIALAAVGAVILGVPAAIAAAIAAVIAAILTAIVLIKQHWNEIVQFFKDGWKKFTDGAKDLWNEFKDGIKDRIEEIKEWFKDKWQSIKDWFDGIKQWFKNIPDAIKQAWQDLKDFFADVLNWITGKISGACNFIISIVENVINAIITGINYAINALNHIKIDVPDWLTDITGMKSFGFNLKEVSEVSLPRVNIPKLAQGAVIPPNKEFMAILGDQKNGTNIETPLETMVEAFRIALAEFNQENDSNNQPIVLQLDRKVIAQAVWDENEKRYKQTGRYATNS